MRPPASRSVRVPGRQSSGCPGAVPAGMLPLRAAVVSPPLGTGPATGLVLGTQAFSASQSVTATDLTLASAPLLMVAIAELTKIPIATLLFSATWLWKPIILAFLLLLAGITFETVFMGLERAGALRQLKYEDLANKIDALKGEESRLTASDQAARQTDQVEQAFAEFDTATAAAEKEREQIQVQIGAVDKELEGSAVLTPEAARIRDQLQEREAERTGLIDRRDQEVREAMDSFERQRDSFVERIKIATAAGNSESVRRNEIEVAKVANPRPRIIAKYDGQLGAIDRRISDLRAEFEELRASNIPADSDQRQDLFSRRKLFEQQLVSSSEKWRARLDDVQSRIASAQGSEAQEANTAAENQARRDAINKEISKLENERIPLARTDQVRRIASRWYGNKPEEVTEDQEGIISVIWFGSLALIAALAGPITAMVALGLQRIAANAEKPVEGKLSRLLRRILLSWRWRRTRAVTVRVEVPIEKEVEKRVEVPVERIVKEIGRAHV